jgi:hypothetical protein
MAFADVICETRVSCFMNYFYVSLTVYLSLYFSSGQACAYKLGQIEIVRPVVLLYHRQLHILCPKNVASFVSQTLLKKGPYKKIQGLLYLPLATRYIFGSLNERYRLPSSLFGMDYASSLFHGDICILPFSLHTRRRGNRNRLYLQIWLCSM